MSARKDCFLSIKSGRVGSRSRTTQTHYLVRNSTYILLNEKQVVFILENVDGNLLLREARQDPKKVAQRTKGYLRKNPCLGLNACPDGWGTFLEKNFPSSNGHLLDFFKPLVGWFGALIISDLCSEN